MEKSSAMFDKSLQALDPELVLKIVSLKAAGCFVILKETHISSPLF